MWSRGVGGWGVWLSSLLPMWPLCVGDWGLAVPPSCVPRGPRDPQTHGDPKKLAAFLARPRTKRSLPYVSRTRVYHGCVFLWSLGSQSSKATTEQLARITDLNTDLTPEEADGRHLAAPHAPSPKTPGAPAARLGKRLELALVICAAQGALQKRTPVALTPPQKCVGAKFRQHRENARGGLLKSHHKSAPARDFSPRSALAARAGRMLATWRLADAFFLGALAALSNCHASRRDEGQGRCRHSMSKPTHHAPRCTPRASRRS